MIFTQKILSHMYSNLDLTKVVFRRALCNLLSILSLDFSWNCILWSKHPIYCFNVSAGWLDASRGLVVGCIRRLFVSKHALKCIPLLPNMSDSFSWGRLKNPERCRGFASLFPSICNQAPPISSLFKHIRCRRPPRVFSCVCEQKIWTIKFPGGQKKLTFLSSVTRVIMNRCHNCKNQSGTATWPAG